MIGPELQQRLNALMQDRGRDALGDPVALETLLRDAASADDPGVGLLVLALRAGIPEAIAAGSSDVRTLTAELRAQHFVAEEAAESAVRAWSQALGASGDLGSSPEPSVEQPPAVHPAPAVAPPPVPGASPIPPSRRGSNLGLVIGLLALAVLVVFGGGGYLLWKSFDRAVPKSAALDLPAYNQKMADFHRRMLDANNAFLTKNNTLIAERNMNTALDKAAPMYREYSETLQRIASDLEATTPPPDVAGIHGKLAANIRRLATMIGDVGEAARQHDIKLFTDRAGKVRDFGNQAGGELSDMVKAEGYDAGQFGMDGTLVKKK